jgi:hypothetical protein
MWRAVEIINRHSKPFRTEANRMGASPINPANGRWPHRISGTARKGPLAFRMLACPATKIRRRGRRQDHQRKAETMATKVSADVVLTDAASIEKVWAANPDLKLGRDGEAITLTDYRASIQALNDFNRQIADLRHALEGLKDRRDDAAARLNGYNTRALSAIRGIFGPDSIEYDQAGGVRTSERKRPTRKRANAETARPA